ncbi:hypothetical protein HOH45_09455 [bacterium]|jgi:hypothetical protein|nr:hypothetical protein [bacterium]
MKSFYIEKELAFNQRIEPQLLKTYTQSSSECICSFSGLTTLSKNAKSSIPELHDVKTYVEDELMFNFIVMQEGLTCLEVRLFHRLLVSQIATYLGKGFFRHYTQVFYNDFHLSMSNVYLEEDISVIYVGLFLNDHLDFNIMGLEGFNVDLKEMGLTVMQKFIHEVNQLMA